MSAIVRNPLQPVNRSNIEKNRSRSAQNENQLSHRVYGDIECNVAPDNRTGSQIISASTHNQHHGKAINSSQAVIHSNQHSQLDEGTASQSGSPIFPCKFLNFKLKHQGNLSKERIF